MVRELTTEDVRRACDVLRPIYDNSRGVDGRVSLEVDPRLAHDTEATVAQALEPYSSRFFQEFVALIEAGQEAGEVVRTPAAELVWICIATLQGLALMRIVPPARVPFPEPRTLLRLFAP